MAEPRPEDIRFPAVAAQKDKLDTLNSLAWFLMDACWMLELYGLAFLLAPLVVATALVLTAIDRRPAVLAVNLALLSWVSMNITWMVSDLGDTNFWLFVSRTCFVVGLAFVGVAVLVSNNFRETFSHFRRFRKMSMLR